VSNVWKDLCTIERRVYFHRLREIASSESNGDFAELANERGAMRLQGNQCGSLVIVRSAIGIYVPT
jgi:hypothetical protein